MTEFVTDPQTLRPPAQMQSLTTQMPARLSLATSARQTNSNNSLRRCQSTLIAASGERGQAQHVGQVLCIAIQVFSEAHPPGIGPQGSERHHGLWPNRQGAVHCALRPGCPLQFLLSPDRSGACHRISVQAPEEHPLEADTCSIPSMQCRCDGAAQSPKSVAGLQAATKTFCFPCLGPQECFFSMDTR